MNIIRFDQMNRLYTTREFVADFGLKKGRIAGPDTSIAPRTALGHKTLEIHTI